MAPQPSHLTVSAKELLVEQTDQSVKMQPIGGSSDMTPLADDFEPSDMDVICSWARQNHRHTGNIRFRKLVDEHAPLYVRAETKYEKTKVIADLIDRIRRDSPEGGFVKKDFYSGRWFEIGVERARDKVGHAIRKAADKLVEQSEGKRSKGGKAKTAVKEHEIHSPNTIMGATPTGTAPGASYESQGIPSSSQPRLNSNSPASLSAANSYPTRWMHPLGIMPQHVGSPADSPLFSNNVTGTMPPAGVVHISGPSVLHDAPPGGATLYRRDPSLSAPSNIGTYMFPQNQQQRQPVVSSGGAMLPPRHQPPPDQDASSSSLYSGRGADPIPIWGSGNASMPPPSAFLPTGPSSYVDHGRRNIDPRLGVSPFTYSMQGVADASARSYLGKISPGEAGGSSGGGGGMIPYEAEDLHLRRYGPLG